MEILRQEEIKIIEERLMEQYGIEFEDIVQEVSDHIACEIEASMTTGIDFNTAYTAVFELWNERLKTNNWGTYKGIPKFIEKQLAEEFNRADWKIKMMGFFLNIPLMFIWDYLELRTEIIYMSLVCIGFLSALFVYYNIRKGKDYLVEFYIRQTKMMFAISILIVIVSIGFTFLWRDQTRTGVFEFFILYGFLSMCYFLFNCSKNLKKNKIIWNKA